MLDVAIMIEGQNGLNWTRWKNMARAVEDLGFAGLYRSDHYTNADPPDRDSLELWVSLTWLAAHTERLEIGPLVSPVSFRHPTMTARMAAAVDDLSGGRLHLGMGAGWQEREHEHYGWDLLDVPERFRRFEEGLEVVARLFGQDSPVDFEGRFYRLHQAVLLPRPARPGGPPIVIGGNGLRRTLPLAARFADEWNGVYLSPDRLRKRVDRLGELLEQQGRSSGSMRRSVMMGCAYGRSQAEFERHLGDWDLAVDELQERGVVAGTGAAVIDQLGAMAEAGAQGVMLQWLDLDDLDRLAGLASDVLPHF